jgi:hypothetical protein
MKERDKDNKRIRRRRTARWIRGRMMTRIERVNERDGVRLGKVKPWRDFDFLADSSFLFSLSFAIVCSIAFTDGRPPSSWLILVTALATRG